VKNRRRGERPPERVSVTLAMSGFNTTEEDLQHLRMAVDEGRKCTPSPTSYCVGAVVAAADGRLFAGYTHETSAIPIRRWPAPGMP